MRLSEEIRADLFRIAPGSFSTRRCVTGLRNQGFRYLLFARLRSSTKNPVFRALLWPVVRRYTYKFGFQIPLKNIGGGLLLGHFGTIVVSANAIIGRDCNIAHNVTIGASRKDHGIAPAIGDRVWIGCGAAVIGGISIGNDVLIAPNAFVNFDVPDHSVVVGNPGVVSSKINPTEGYINNKFYS